VKKEVTTAEREVQNKKEQACRVAERERKAHAFTVALEEEKRERLTIMVARSQAQEDMKMRELLGEAKIDGLAGATLSSSITSRALRPPMVPRSPTTPTLLETPILQVHAPSRLRGT
jgi:hypothetical protein